MDIEQHIYGMSEEGEAVIVYILRAENGAEVQVTNLGASVTSIQIPNGEGKIEDVLLGYVDMPNMLRDIAYMGRTLGRTVGRIASGEVTIGGVEHLLDINAGSNHVHGGAHGFHKRMWESRVETNRVVMSLYADDGESGYPGNMNIEAIFDFDDDMTLEITYLAKSDAQTLVNIGSSLYFNLSGDMGSTILDHELKINASQVCEVDSYGVTTGSMLSVDGSPMDFREGRTIGTDIKSEFNEMFYLRGYDHILPIDGHKPTILSEQATLRDPKSGRYVTISSSQSALGVYTGNHLAAGSPVGTKSGSKFVAYQGVALIPQSCPISELAAGELYCQKSTYCFGVSEV